MNSDRRIAIASDHAGFELKEKLEAALGALGFEVEDLGTDRRRPPPTIRTTRIRWPNGVERPTWGAGCCSAAPVSGCPTWPTAIAHVRAAVAWTPEIADAGAPAQRRQRARAAGAFRQRRRRRWQILKTWLDTPFEGGRHERRVEKIERPSLPAERSHDSLGGLGPLPAGRRAARRPTPRSPAHRGGDRAAERRDRTHRQRELRVAGGARSAWARRSPTSTPRGCRASATTAAARWWTRWSSWPSIGPSSCSAPSTPTCSRTRARRRTWRCSRPS